MRVVAVVVVIALFAHFVDAAPLDARAVDLRIDPETTLAGLPVAMLVTLPADFVERGVDHVDAVLLVRSEANGETFEARFDDPNNVRGWIATFNRTAAAADRVEVQIPLNPPAGPEWFADERLQQPGTYHLRLRIIGADLGLPADVLSSEATLTVREPQGVDADAWAWLQARKPSGWNRREWFESGPDVARELIERFPSSTYAQYAIGIFTRGRDAQSWLRRRSPSRAMHGSRTITACSCTVGAPVQRVRVPDRALRNGPASPG